MLKMILNDNEYSCEIESFSEGLNRTEQDNQTFQNGMILYELTINIKTQGDGSSVNMTDFVPFMKTNSITSIQLVNVDEEQESVIFSTDKFSEIFNTSKLVNKYQITEAAIAIYFRSVEGLS